MVNFIYQVPKVASGALGVLANDWQVSGIYRWTSGRPYPVTVSIPGIGAANLIGNDGNPAVRVALTCDPGKGWSGDPYRQIENPECFAPPQPGSDGAESARFFLRNAPTNNLDLSIAKKFLVGKGEIGLEVRLDAFNALNHTQFITRQQRPTWGQLREPDQPDDHEPGLRRQREPRPEQRLRRHPGRGRASPASARDAVDVLGRTAR